MAHKESKEPPTTFLWGKDGGAELKRADSQSTRSSVIQQGLPTGTKHF